MTFLDNSPGRVRPSSLLELTSRWYQKRCFQKRYVCFWIVVIVFPFTLLRLLFLCNVSSGPEQTPNLNVVMKSEELLSRRHQNIISSSLPAADLDANLPITHENPDIRADEWISPDSSLDWRGNKNQHDEIPNENHLRVTEGNGPSGLSEDNEKKDRVASGQDQEKDTVKLDTFEGDTVSVVETDDRNSKDQTKEEAQPHMEGLEQDATEAQAGKPFANEEWHPEQENGDDLRNAEGRLVVGKKAVEENWNIAQQEWNQPGKANGNEDEEAAKGESTNGREKAEQNEADSLVGEQNNAEETDQRALIEEQIRVEETEGEGENHLDVNAIPQEGLGKPNVQNGESKPAGECDLFDGDWEYDPEGPLYTNSTCFYMQATQDCMSNGRPDEGYLHWKWKPRDCDLPRFDARSFLEAFKGKAIGFVGDSLARNQMQSLLCMLSQVEVPTQVYQAPDDSTVRWLYEQHQVTLMVVWSPYLLKESSEGIMGFEKGQSVLFWDVLDTSWTTLMQDFDIIVLSTGQWYFKGSVYVKDDKVVGCHYCDSLNLTQIRFADAYKAGLRQTLEKVATEFKGIAIMSTFAMSHFEDGPWANGGQCRREKPLEKEEGERFPGQHNEMHDIVMDEFNAIAADKSKLNKDLRLEFLDVTKISLLRADGHPGPYRRAHPYAGRNPEEWVPNDCLHWCLPGPVDTWNQLLVKLAHRHL